MYSLSHTPSKIINKIHKATKPYYNDQQAQAFPSFNTQKMLVRGEMGEMIFAIFFTNLL
jgi:hypothetical protein